MTTSGYPLFSIANLVDIFVNRNFGLPKKVNKDVKIFVFQHFPVRLPECFENRAIYIPIHGGNAPSDGAMSDTSEPSISKYNVYLNEMTQIYWIGKHYQELGNPEYIGFAHYRRCLEWSAELLLPNRLFASKYISLMSNRELFIDCHGADWLNRFLNEFRKVFSDFEYGDVDEYWDARTLYIANNLITDRTTFMRYFEFIERCIGICIRLLQDNLSIFELLDRSRRRQFSFILERMTSYWIWHEKRRKDIKVICSRLRCYDIDNGLTAVR